MNPHPRFSAPTEPALEAVEELTTQFVLSSGAAEAFRRFVGAQVVAQLAQGSVFVGTLDEAEGEYLQVTDHAGRQGVLLASQVVALYETFPGGKR